MEKQIIFNNPYNKKKQMIESIDFLPFTVIKYMYNNIYDLSSNNDIIEMNNIKKEYEKEIKKKLGSYKAQDKHKNKYDKEQIISYNDIIKKLYDCELKCFYCQQDTVILFNKKREGLQWTLERLDNNIGHYDSNTCISCLKCNLQRRTDNYEYFKMGKQFKINIIK
jgi:NAD-dependent dihydropyrimidine dehydrogenase PreA subunit